MKRIGTTTILLAGFLLGLAGNASSAFEETSPGARVRSFAGAFCAVADDSETVFVQPAGISRIRAPEIGLTFGRLFAGLKDDSNIADSIAAVALPLSGRVGLGLGYKNLALDSVYREETVVLGCAVNVGRWLSVGAGAKYLRLSYGRDRYTSVDPVFSNTHEKTALDADAGLLLVLSPSFRLAYSRSNLLGGDIGIQEISPLIPSDRVAFLYREETFLMTLEGVSRDRLFRFLSGIEKWFFRNAFAFRLGIGWGDRSYRTITPGFGVAFEPFRLDYAWDYPLSGIEQTAGTHYLTLLVRVGGTARGKDARLAEPAAPAVVVSSAAASDESPAATLPGPQTLNPALWNPPVPVGGGMRGGTAGGRVIEGASGLASRDSVIFCRKSSCRRGSTLNFDAPSPLSLFAAAPVRSIGRIAVSPETKNDIAFSSLTVVRARACLPEERASAPVATSTAAAVSPSTVSALSPGTPPAAKKKRRADTKPEAQTTTTVDAEKTGASKTVAHRVKAGETLPLLAERYYGSRDRWLTIYEANKDKIEKGSLTTGELLVIPRD